MTRPPHAASRATAEHRRRTQRPTLALSLSLLALGLSGCKTLTRPSGVPARLSAGEVPLALEEARGELDRGDVRRAFFRAKAARETDELQADLRVQAEALYERAVRALIDHESSPQGNPQVLKELVTFEGVPVPLAVRAGVRGARILFERDAEREKAFRLIKRVDEKFPHHQERVAAGDLLADIGFSFAADDGRYALFFAYRDHAIPVFEYLVLNYPNQARCDRAYFTLAELYEADRAWGQAISRHEDLVLYHPTSPHVPASRARIPHLRLASQASPEYDRHEIALALEETETWLLRYAESELAPGVAADRLDALQRLADNDLTVGRFYFTVGNRVGAERHARRAIEAARAIGDVGEPATGGQLADAERLLAKIVAELPETPPEGESPVLPDPRPAGSETDVLEDSGGGGG